MGEKISFSSVSNDLIHNFRERMNHSENVTDLMNNFSYTVSLFMNTVSPDFLGATVKDITFMPTSPNHFVINEELFSVKEFKEIYEQSDMASIITKFAETTNHKYTHLMMHNEKTTSKVRN